MCVLYNLPHFCTACVTVRFVNDINCSVFLSWVAVTCLSAIGRLANASSHWERIQKRIQKRKPGFNDRKLKHQKQCETSETLHYLQGNFAGFFGLFLLCLIQCSLRMTANLTQDPTEFVLGCIHLENK